MSLKGNYSFVPYLEFPLFSFCTPGKFRFVSPLRIRRSCFDIVNIIFHYTYLIVVLNYTSISNVQEAARLREDANQLKRELERLREVSINFLKRWLQRLLEVSKNQLR